MTANPLTPFDKYFVRFSSSHFFLNWTDCCQGRQNLKIYLASGSSQSIRGFTIGGDVETLYGIDWQLRVVHAKPVIGVNTRVAVGGKSEWVMHESVAVNNVVLFCLLSCFHLPGCMEYEQNLGRTNGCDTNQTNGPA